MQKCRGDNYRFTQLSHSVIELIEIPHFQTFKLPHFQIFKSPNFESPPITLFFQAAEDSIFLGTDKLFGNFADNKACKAK
jgi:hypothetical protein